ncbi:hypothetical protein E4U55_005700 [Claviceps digitariae]|nr:hypothetical protein E4U55_005700 [Claviceps digitariae]
MSDSEPIPETTSEADGPELAFKVYITDPDMDEPSVLEALCGENEEDFETFRVELLDGYSTQEVIEHHKEINHNESGTNSTLLLVVDSTDLEERGMLLVSLEEYHGFDDAIRLIPEDANNIICSLSISNDDWFTVRQDVPEVKTAATPLEWFALYNAMAKKYDYYSALREMNVGLQEMGVDQAEEDGDPAEVPKFYKPARAGNRNLDQIISDHPFYAEEHDVDPDHFALVDGDYRTKGALLVQLVPERDSFRCEGYVAGEILRWIYINFMTWDEAKDFAGGQ